MSDETDEEELDLSTPAIIEQFPKELFDFSKRSLSYSSLKNMLVSPRHFAHNWVHRKEPTPAMILGSVVDCLLLTPDEFDVRFAISPVCDRRTKDGKATYGSFMQTLGSKRAVPGAMHLLAKVLVERVKTNPFSKPFFDSCHTTQHPMEWIDKQTGLPLKGILDAISLMLFEDEERDIVWDLKICKDASTDGFQRDAIKMCYPLQQHTYSQAYIRRKGVFPEFRFICVESTAPYAINVFRPDNDFAKLGRNMYRESLDKVKHCLDNDCFGDDYYYLNTSGYNTLSVPGWVRKNID